MGYGKRAWNELTRGPTEPIGERTARSRHRRGDAYGVVLTAGSGEGPSPPVVGIYHGRLGITVWFYDHDLAAPNLAVFWERADEESPFHPVQVDHRAGNGDHVPHAGLVYEYLKLTKSPVPWIRWTEAGATVLEPGPT